jgi:hypothetical protein
MKKRYSSIWVGGKLKKLGQVFGNPLWQLLSPLNMEPICVSSYSWVIFLSSSHTNSMRLHSFSSSQRVLLFPSHYILGTHQVNASKSVVMPHHVQGSFNSSHPFVVLPVSISYVSTYSFNSPSYITLLCQFHVNDGGYIKDLLQ